MCDIYIHCCRLCPKKTVATSATLGELTQLAQYGSSEEFTMTLDAWSLKYKSMQSIRDETPAETILRLSAKLCNNKVLLEVSVVQLACSPLATLNPTCLKPGQRA